jgi:hypothetical protein
MSEDPAFAKQCLFDAIDRLSIRDGDSEIFAELANYLDALGELGRAAAVRRANPNGDAQLWEDELAEHFEVGHTSELIERDWVAVPTAIDSEKAKELLEAYAKALD